MVYEMHMGDDGILRMLMTDDMKKEVLEAFIEDFTPFLEAAAEADKPLLLLVDVYQVGKLSPSARKTFAQLGRDPRLGKCAVVGLSRYNRVIAGFINKAAGRDNIHFFDAQEKALAWLKG